MKKRHKRAVFIFACLAAIGLATWLVLGAFRNNLVFFFSPTQIATKEAPVGKTFRIGGLVQDGTLKRDNDGLTIRFTVTDTANTIPVVYKGTVPDLFRTGRDVVVDGRLRNGIFVAVPNTLVTKCPSKYQPKRG